MMTSAQLLQMAKLLVEAAECLRKVRGADFDKAWEVFGIRDYLPDELDGAALMLTDASDSVAPSAPVQAVPDGWMLVPKEPTNEMTAAAERECFTGMGISHPIYRAMLSAAPQPPKRGS